MTAPCPRWLFPALLLAVASALGVPAVASATPEVLSAGFRSPPQAGQSATLELRFREPAGYVHDVHVDWGDRSVDYAVVAQPDLLDPPGTPQTLLLDHIYERPGFYPLRVELYSRDGEARHDLDTNVGPCQDPTLRLRWQRDGRRGGALQITARDGDTLITKLGIVWGDGRRQRIAATYESAARHGDPFVVDAPHRFRRPGRYRIRVTAISSQNPSGCPDGVNQRAARRITVSAR